MSRIADGSYSIEAERRLRKLKYKNEIEVYIKEFCKEAVPAFSDYLNQIMNEKGVRASGVLENSGVNKNYGYNIINGIRSNPSRDKIIALCIGAGMGFEEMQMALEISRVGRLLYFDERDVRIAAAVNSGITRVVEINMILSEYNLPLINY